MAISLKTPTAFLRRACGLLTAVSLALAAIPAMPTAAVTSLTYTLVPEQKTVSATAIAAGDVTVPVSLYIGQNTGVASILVTFALPDNFSMTAGDFADPYCFGNGDPSLAGTGTSFNVKQTKALWYSSAGIANDKVFDESLSFLTFDVTIPKGTPDGVYDIGFRDEKIPLGDTDLTQPTCCTVVVEGKKLLDADVKLVGCQIKVGNAVSKGDVDDNGVINTTDAILALRDYAAGLLGKEVLTDKQRLAADVDGNGRVDTADATFILRYVAMQMLGTEVSWDKILPKK